ncbi:MAG: sugar nucleotide-binding protein, partial [Rhodospirillales bacterium]|nr:sugar nucleotide-binding protein [Rhodospirillales bacterium]
MTENRPHHWMITGASGLLGHALCGQLVADQKTVSALKSTHDVGIDGLREFAVDITEAGLVQKIIRDMNPDVIVHAAGITNVDECENDPALAQAVHVEGSRHIAREAQLRSIPLVYISTPTLFMTTVGFNRS